MAEIIKTTGIVLKSSKHTIEAARLLDIFSPEMGKFSAVIRGVEKPKAKLAVASQPFCLGEFMLAEKNGYYTVTDCYVVDSFFSLAYNLDAYVLGCSMLEISGKLAQAGESNVELFTLLLNTLKVMAYEDAEPSACLVKFIIETLKLSGFGFDLKTCEKCGKPLKDEKRVGIVYTGSGALCENHKSGDFVNLNSDEWKTLSSINDCPLSALATLKDLPRASLNSCLGICLKQFYYRTGERISSVEKYL